MNLNRALQFSTAALAILGAIFMGLGPKVFLPLLLGVAAVTSVVATDLYGVLRLNRYVANAIAVAAVVWSLRGFMQTAELGGKMLAIADMLIYLQIVLLFQEKSGRVHWQLLVLSLLQVVVAADQSLGPQFGLLLAVYLLLAILTMVLLCLARETNAAASSAEHTPPAKPTAPGWEMLLAAPQTQQVPGGPSLARLGVVGREVGLVAAATALFAVIFFFAIPRQEQIDWGTRRGRQHSSTGFSMDARLEETGRIHQSNRLVMRATLTRVIDHRPYMLIGDPYFHGTTLSNYLTDATGSRWSRRARPTSRYLDASEPPSPPLARGALIRQEFTLEGVGPEVVFAVLPVRRLTDTPPDLHYDPRVGRIVRHSRAVEELPQSEFRYAFGTISLINGRQLHGLPHPAPLGELDRFALHDDWQKTADRFPRLAAKAQEIIDKEGLAAGTELERALALERHFLSPGLYRYTLDFTSVGRDRSLDPIEDFVANHKSGHCEYFASALVMMLRSQGIPARMVVGYKGGDFNSLGRYYQVREKHAHAWVEALLSAGQVPEGEIAGSATAGDVWYRLDPTPVSYETDGNLPADSAWDRVVEAFDYVELMWRDYVLGLNAAKQRDQLYDPVSRRANPWLDTARMPPWWQNLAARLATDAPASSDPTPGVFNWGLAGAMILFILLAATLAQMGLWLWPRLRRWLSARRSGPRQPPRAPEFYRRLEAALARLPVRRAPGQTAQELAAAAGNRLAATSAPEAAPLPAEVVAAYYRVRFGGAPLDNHEQAAIEQALAQIVSAVQRAQP